MASDNIQNQIRTAIQAAQSGNKGIARHILEEVVKEAPNSEAAWMWLASVVDTPEERRDCLERVLAINPENERAQQAIAKLPPPREEEDFDYAARLSPSRSGPASPTAPETRSIRPERPSVTTARPPTTAPVSRESLTDPRLSTPPRSSLTLGDEGGRRGLPPVVFVMVAVLALGMIGAGIYLLLQDTQAADETPTPTAVGPAPTPTERVFGYAGTNTPTWTPQPTSTIAPTWTPSVTPTSTLTPTPTTTPLPLNSYNFIVSGKRGGSTRWELYRLNGEGRQEQQIQFSLPDTGDSGAGLVLLELYDVAFLPDGSQLAGTVRLGSGAREFEEIFVAPANGGEIRVLTSLQSPSIEDVSWSPDGGQLVFASNHDGDYDLYLIQLAGGNPTALTNNDADDHDPAWSPTDNVIVFASDQATPSELEIWRITTSGQNLERLTEAENSSFSPAWSPDGEWIVFLSDRRQNTDVFVMTADGTGERALIVRDVSREERDPAWSADGAWISFSSNREGPVFDLYVIRPDGSELQRITEKEGDTRFAVWIP
ncbi:MAG: PD40 domain-containing protein [Anaerolineae bacterium]|nr:PD40 domain-containing protein [Anaerolineae bacterium]